MRRNRSTNACLRYSRRLPVNVAIGRIRAYAIGARRVPPLFRDALAELQTMPDLVNHALKVVEDGAGQVTIYLYRIPEAQNGL